MVSSNSILFMILSFIISAVVPLIAIVFLKKKYNISIKSVIVGALTFFICVMLLEGTINKLILNYNSTTSKLFKNPLNYMLYVGIMAGIFEETGKFIVFKYILKKDRSFKNGITYGLGYGFMEALFLVGFTSINNIITAFQINSGAFDKLLQIEGVPVESLVYLRNQMIYAPSYIWGFAGLERISIFIIQMALCILVLYAVKEKKYMYFILAILLHSSIDFPVALYQIGYINSLAFVEEFLIIVAILAIIFLIKISKIFKKSVV